MTQGLKSLARLLDRVPFAPVVALLFGVVAAILILAMPGWMFEHMVVASGLPGLVPAAAPPLGDKARIMAAIIALMDVAGLLWLVLGLFGRMTRPKPAQSRGHRIEPEYDLAGLEMEPDIAVRRPLFADADLGAPFMSDEAIAHVRDELVLETLAPDEESGIVGLCDAVLVPDLPPLEAAPAENLPPVPEQEQGAQPEPAVQSRPATPQSADRDSIPALLDRLEQALERREHRTGSSAPILPGDMAALRRALGGSDLRH